ncbi:nuclear speckle splicing regulatory protein 1 [Amphiprion ocellaris]|uniref:Nuclear speckle splicing regulatory protein 1 n=1 Tax=Amphiprion ocellaris TaxID=80972 RepID=A0AAQ5YJ53_AMPOC|nr:nuclear speckle splicing regulatory protein 1 [Amphiprion ocellaris]
MAVPTKQYGLILPQKKGASKTAALQKPSVFGDDSDDETSVGESLQREAIKKKMMKQTRLEMQKALEQDSTVYDYDAVYDDIQKQRLEGNKKILGGADKRPKYIHQLMKAVEDRKKEQERREERKIQKEREAEGEQFADKEAYVTSAYRQKLQEQKEEEEREKRQAAMEAALDVKKQRDLSGFYRHLLNQTVGEEAIPDHSANRTETSVVSKDTERTSPLPSPTSHDNIPSSCSDSEEGHEQKSGFSKPGGASTHSKRQYRQRSPSSGSGEDKEKERERERDRHKKSHRDQERDRGRDRDRERDRNRDRGRERDDRHSERRSDRDRRKDRDRDRGREDDRGRGRGDSEREERYGRRERSPKDRERDKNGEREKRKYPDEDKRKDRHLEEERERRKEQEKEKAVRREEKDPEKKEAVGEHTEEKEYKQKKEGEEKEETEEKASKFAKRSTDNTVSSARERYMARQMARSACKSYIEREED